MCHTRMIAPSLAPHHRYAYTMSVTCIGALHVPLAHDSPLPGTPSQICLHHERDMHWCASCATCDRPVVTHNELYLLLSSLSSVLIAAQAVYLPAACPLTSPHSSSTHASALNTRVCSPIRTKHAHCTHHYLSCIKASRRAHRKPLLDGEEANSEPNVEEAKSAPNVEKKALRWAERLRTLDRYTEGVYHIQGEFHKLQS